MQFQKVIEKRRSARKFTSKLVKDDLIKKIIENGILAPSSKNRQPWKFMIVKGDIKNSIADKMIEVAEKQNKNVDPSILLKNVVYKTAFIMKDAPVAILIFKSAQYESNEGDLLSIGACIENMVLTATDNKIAALWFTSITAAKKEVLETLKIKDLELVSAVLLGYPVEIPNKVVREKYKDTIIELKD